MTQLTRAVPQPPGRVFAARFTLTGQLPRLPVQSCPLYCAEGLVCSDTLPLHCCETAGVAVANKGFFRLMAV